MTDAPSDRRLISRRALLIGGSGLLAGYLVGCGDNEEGGGEQTASPATATTRTLAATPTPAATLRWRKLEPAGAAPPGRRDHSLVTDGRSLLLFGGRNDSGDLGDYWTYEFSGDTWLEPEVGEGPAARFGHNAVIDERLGGMVVFGGQAGGSFFNDTWLLESQAPVWRQLDAGEAAPSQRYGAASALDASGRLLVSHGFTNQGRFDDTWSLDAALAWADVSPAENRPVKRCLVRGVWDAKRDRFLIFGGQTDGTPFLGDLWALDANGWTDITSEPKPSPRNFYAMVAMDSALMALFGGNTADEPGPMNDLWFLDTSIDTWTRMVVEGDAPSPRYGHDAVWLPESRKLIVFGGHDASGDVNDLWELTVPA